MLSNSRSASQRFTLVVTTGQGATWSDERTDGPTRNMEQSEAFSESIGFLYFLYTRNIGFFLNWFKTTLRMLEPFDRVPQSLQMVLKFLGSHKM